MAFLAACLPLGLPRQQWGRGQGMGRLGKYRGFNEDGEVEMKEFLWRFSPYNFHALHEIDIEPNPSPLVMDLIDELKQAPAKLVVGTEGVQCGGWPDMRANQPQQNSCQSTKFLRSTFRRGSDPKDPKDPPPNFMH